MLNVKTVDDAEIAADFQKVASLFETTHHVHSRLVEFPLPPEALKAAADDHVFLKHGDFDAVAGEEGAGEESADAAACDHDAKLFGKVAVAAHDFRGMRIVSSVTPVSASLPIPSRIMVRSQSSDPAAKSLSDTAWI